MTELNKQQLCAELSISESTVRRLEQRGLPYTPIGARSHRYNLEECKRWLRMNPPDAGKAAQAPGFNLTSASEAFMESSRKMKLRVRPSVP